jgi:hypothetical protein
MTQRVLGPTGGRRRKRLAIFVPFVAIAALILAIGASAGPISTAAHFEGDDGNLVVDTPATEMDWNGFSPATWTGTAPSRQSTKVVSGWDFTGIEDAQEATTDSAFAGGTKQDDACANVGTGKAPNKDDLKRIYIASKTVGTHKYLALAWARIPQNTTSSSAHVGFEFNQNPTLCAGTGHDGLVPRSTANGGDMLIVYDFEGGDSPVILKLLRWKDSSTDAAGDVCDASGKAVPAAPAGCWVFDEELTGTGNGEAKVNTQDASDAIAPPAGTVPPDTLHTQEFGEAIIDLTGAGVFPETPTSCLSFGKVFGVSRSSGNSSQAQMKDLVGPANINIANCGTVIIHKATVPSSDTTTSFSFTKNFATDPTTVNTFSLTGGDCSTSCGTKTYSGTVLPKTDGRVTESDPSGSNYLLTSITCTQASTATNVATNATTGTVNGVPARTVEFDLAAGQTLECTFTNTRQKVQSSMDTAPWYYPNDKATVRAGTGQTDVTGSVTFRLFQDANSKTALVNCQANGTDGRIINQTVNLTGTGTSKDVNTTNTTVAINTTQTVYWRVEYSGDTNHFGRLSDCVENINATLTGDTNGTNVP